MRIFSIEHYLQLDPSQLANSVLACPYCGRDHTIPYRFIKYGPGARKLLLEVVEQCLGHPPACIGLIYDRHIEEIIETFILPVLQSSNCRLLCYPLGEKGAHLEPNDFVGEAAAAEIDPSVEILVGAGSGVICDLTKLISHIINRPSIICGTAASMNAYTSITAVITENKFKISKFVRVSDAVIMDTDILAGAPLEMTLAGMGDLAARAICNADFRLSHLLKKTYFCPLPYQLTAPYEQRYLAAAEGIGHSTPSAIETLSQAILVSGYSMTMVDGETFPSSGAEHVLSHFWDLQHEMYNAPKNLHGTQVAIGTLINLAMYAFLKKCRPGQFNTQQIIRTRPTLQALYAENLAKFGAAGQYLNQVTREKYLPDEQLQAYLKHLFSNWDAILADLEPYITPQEVIYSAFQTAQAPTTLASIHRSEQEVLDALIYGNRYRLRFTILDLLWELGLMPEVATEILRSSRVVKD